MTKLVRAVAMTCLGSWLASTGAAAQAPAGQPSQPAPNPGFSGSTTAVADTLAKWGLVGTWSVDCAGPPGRTNTHTTYTARPNRTAYYTRQWGDGGDTEPNEIDTATIRDDGVLAMTETMPAFKQTREFWLLKGPDGRARALMNRQVGGDYTVRDGKFVSNGRETPWSSRCR